MAQGIKGYWSKGVNLANVARIFNVSWSTMKHFVSIRGLWNSYMALLQKVRQAEMESFLGSDEIIRRGIAEMFVMTGSRIKLRG